MELKVNNKKVEHFVLWLYISLWAMIRAGRCYRNTNKLCSENKKICVILR